MADLFRKKSLDSLNTPDNLDEFLKVTNFSGWMILIACILVVGGVLIWGFTADIDGITVIQYLFNK
ncbi:MAG: hypothetical protein PHP76_08450 [Bacteroidales bacterium]|nr:hypothetical protein [Bacteroidales bacterium]